MASPAVPTSDGDLDDPPPSASPAASRRGNPEVQGSDSEAFARFQRFLAMEREGRMSPYRPRRIRDRDEDD